MIPFDDPNLQARTPNRCVSIAMHSPVAIYPPSGKEMREKT
jgi:hypothetical protein